MADAWPFDPDSKLVELAKTIYKKQNKQDVEVIADMQDLSVEHLSN